MPDFSRLTSGKFISHQGMDVKKLGVKTELFNLVYRLSFNVIRFNRAF